jgi:hypothetical protein
VRRGALIPDRSIALLLGLLTALARLPFVAQRLWEWDSVLYARALEQGFHVDDVLAASRPHPPGYIFYVGAAAVGRALGLDSDHALVAVSIVASGVAVGMLYLLCRQFAPRALAILLSLSFAAAPLVWLHGEVAMPYILLATLSTSLTLAFRAARGRSGWPIIGASLLFGALAGFRQDLLLFFIPLWLWMVAPAPARARVRAVGAVAVGCLLWFVPSAALSDGPAEYVVRSARQLVGVSATSANAERSIALNAVLIGYSLAWGLLFLLVVLVVVGLARALAAPRARSGGRGEALFFGLWIAPPLVFYLFVHIGEWGFVLSLVPALYAMLAWLLAPIAAAASRAARRSGAVLMALNGVAGALLFMAGSDPVFSAASLADHDRATDAKVAFITARVATGEPVVVVAAAEALVAGYYLPGRTVWYSDRGSAARLERVLDRPTTVIIYEPRARPLSGEPVRSVDVGGGASVGVLQAGPGPLLFAGPSLDTGSRSGGTGP